MLDCIEEANTQAISGGEETDAQRNMDVALNVIQETSGM